MLNQRLKKSYQSRTGFGLQLCNKAFPDLAIDKVKSMVWYIVQQVKTLRESDFT